MKIRAKVLDEDFLLVYVNRYDPILFDMIAALRLGRFVQEEKGGGHAGWKMKLDMDNCRQLREGLGDVIVFSDELLEWGLARKSEMTSLVDLAAQADEEDLPVIKERIPEMFDKLRPFQRVGIKWVARAGGCLVADDPGLGKTWEVIGGIYEAGLADGPNLVVCPKIAIEPTWLYELNRFQDNPVFVAPEGRKERDRLLEEVEMCLDIEQPFWLVVNPHMLTYRRTNDQDKGVYDPLTDQYFLTQFPFLMRTQWNTVTVDEAHESGLPNPGSQTARALHRLGARKRIAVTGTPMGGKPMRLWGILHWADPKEFAHKTRWAERWVETTREKNAEGNTYVKFGGIKKGREEAFAKAHAHYILRRRKNEVFKELPDKDPIDVWLQMNDEQARQYSRMEDEAEAIIYEQEQETGRISMTNMLSTYNWLRQFSFGVCDVVEGDKKWNDLADEWIQKYKAKATSKSPKLEWILEFLSELGVTDGSTTEQVVIFSQFKHVVDRMHADLTAAGIPTEKITGDVTKRGVRAEIQARFQEGTGARVVVMTIKAGGVSINLDAANTAIFVDETWNPDEKLQAEDRIHRASRIHQVTVYTLRCRKTIDEEVDKANKEKRNINDVLLDRYRKSVEGKNIEW